mmetsp:Transcript_29364/g.47406  ORF Transcript_29364/g.47406 Transcript_29364/m.47406 type:complete len:214 (-) Transcript_29364:1131-1772(-)
MSCVAFTATYRYSPASRITTKGLVKVRGVTRIVSHMSPAGAHPYRSLGSEKRLSQVAGHLHWPTVASHRAQPFGQGNELAAALESTRLKLVGSCQRLMDRRYVPDGLLSIVRLFSTPMYQRWEEEEEEEGDEALALRRCTLRAEAADSTSHHLLAAMSYMDGSSVSEFAPAGFKHKTGFPFPTAESVLSSPGTLARNNSISMLIGVVDVLTSI